MKKLAYILIMAVLLAAAAFLIRGQKSIPVQTVEVERSDIEDLVVNTRTGTLKACQRAQMSPPIGGQIKNLRVREGDSVEAGQLLLELWNDDLQAQLTIAHATQASNRDDADAACLMADNAGREYQRQKKLVASALISADQLDKTKTQADADLAQCKAARHRFEVAKGQYQLAKAQLDKTRLYAPFNGVVADIQGEVGEFVTPSPIGISTPPVVDLVNNQCFYVEAPIDEVDAPRVKTGMPVRVLIDALPSPIQATVTRVADYVSDRERQARTVTVEVSIPDADSPSLLAGYSADVEIVTQTHQDVPVIPTAAILADNQVYRVNTGSHELETVSIKKGISNWRSTEVTDGLSVGDSIVTSLEQKDLKAGVRVVINND